MSIPIPKVCQWISERYPYVSQTVRGKEIAQFDNFYMDINSIIHSCYRPNVTKEKIFEDIFHYIELLFQRISPKKLFFIAVDGVVPWAKVNTERGLRFKRASDQLLKQKAKKAGTVASEIEGFDSNCITPGTEFMANLQKSLEDSISERISNDSTWQGIEIYLSGHGVPGEGENKIMDFIRYARWQADYNRYTKHCLYGLETDLILYGMSSHEPLFTLFREREKFTCETSKTDEINFYFLHLSLLREYLEFEFSSLKGVSFGFDLEMIIDDWVFMMFLIGNDFIPPLSFIPPLRSTPSLPFTDHKYFLPRLYETYNKVLPALDGYINKHGQLNLDRFKTFMKALSCYDVQLFNKDSENFHQYRNTYYDNIKNFKKDCVSQYVDAIQWNLNYYYDGCTSWRVCYPYNYSPYASDVAVDNKNRVEVTLGEPLLPLQHLLAVLPPASRKLLPTAYQKINEELANLYPTFATGPSVVLLPFVDPNHLTESVEKLTNTEEEKRNVHTNHLLFKFGIDKPEEINKDFFHLDRQKIKHGILPHVQLGHRVFPGFPSFKTEFNRMILEASVKKNGMILEIKDQAKFDINYAKYLIGQEIYVDWPYLSVGLVDSFRTKGSMFSGAGKTFKESPMTPEQKHQYTDDYYSIGNKYYRNSKEIAKIGPINIILDVKRLIPNDNGNAEKQWNDKTDPFAFQTTFAEINLYPFSNFQVKSCLDKPSLSNASANYDIATKIMRETPLETKQRPAHSIVTNEQSTIATNQEAYSAVAEQPRDVCQKVTGRKIQTTKTHTNLKSDHDRMREYDEIFTEVSRRFGVEELNYHQLQNFMTKLLNDLKSQAEKLLPPFSDWTDKILQENFCILSPEEDLETYIGCSFDKTVHSENALKKLNKQLECWLKILDVGTFEVIETSRYNEASTRLLLNEIIKAVLGDGDNYHVMVEEPVGHYVDHIGYISGKLDYSFYKMFKNRKKKFLGLLEAKKGDKMDFGEIQATIEIIVKAKAEQNLEGEQKIKGVKYFAIASTGYKFRFMLLTDAIPTYQQSYTIYLSKIYCISNDLREIISVFKQLLEVTSE